MDTIKKKLLRIKKIKFLRNIIISVVALIIVALIINIAPGYKRDKYKDVINLIVNDENKTEELKHNIYVNENGSIYISEDDVKYLFDTNIYYDDKYNQIITTSDTKVASIVANEKKITINNSTDEMIDSIIKIDDNVYLPISDMDIVYNIDVKYIEDTNRVIIDKLNKGMIRAIVSEKTDIKYRPRGLSKKIGSLNIGQSVYCFYTTSKGWRQIRTQDGILGYVKANKLTSEYILRQDMQEKEKATIISMDSYKNNKIDVTNKINIEVVYSINENNIEINGEGQKRTEYDKTWVTLSNNLLGNKTNAKLEDYKSRTNLINIIVDKVIENDISGIVVDFNGIENKEGMLRFIIELTPRLREVGVNTSIVLNENIEKDNYTNIVDYIIE